MSDPIPDIEPPAQPNVVSSVNAAPVASANSFLLYLLILLVFLVGHRFSWECLLTLVPVFGTQWYYKAVWLLPAAGIIAAVLNPNAGAALAWAGFSSIVSGIPVLIVGFKILSGTDVQPQSRTSPPA